MIKWIVRWLLLAATVLYLITGFGITEFRTVESLTFGLLTKNLSFQIHNNLLFPFVVLMVSHIVLTYYFRLRARKK